MVCEAFAAELRYLGWECEDDGDDEDEDDEDEDEDEFNLLIFFFDSFKSSNLLSTLDVEPSGTSISNRSITVQFKKFPRDGLEKRYQQ